MAGSSVYERLRQSRISRGEVLSSIAQRSGVRESLLQAVEEGRFADLPRGIYGRSAIRSFANALGLDASQVLAECEAFLVPTDDPIDALARLRGCRPTVKPAAPEAPAATPQASWNESSAIWKPLGAAAIDSLIIMGLLLFLVAATMTFCAAPLSAFRGAAAAFGVMGVLLAAGYFLWFAGIACATMGERAMGMAAAASSPASHDLNSVLARSVRAVLRDVSSIRALGDSLGRAATDLHARMHSPTTTA
jgi:transcriptional regulator with XRE-family HTH domain